MNNISPYGSNLLFRTPEQEDLIFDSIQIPSLTLPELDSATQLDPFTPLPPLLQDSLEPKETSLEITHSLSPLPSPTFPIPESVRGFNTECELRKKKSKVIEKPSEISGATTSHPEFHSTQSHISSSSHEDLLLPDFPGDIDSFPLLSEDPPLRTTLVSTHQIHHPFDEFTLQSPPLTPLLPPTLSISQPQVQKKCSKKIQKKQITKLKKAIKNHDLLNHLATSIQTEVVKYIPPTSSKCIPLSEIDYSLGYEKVEEEGRRRWDNKEERIEYIHLGLKKNISGGKIRKRYFAFAIKEGAIRKIYNTYLFPSIKAAKGDKIELTEIQGTHKIVSTITFESFCQLAEQPLINKKNKKEIDFIPQGYTKVIEKPAVQTARPLTSALPRQLDHSTSTHQIDHNTLERPILASSTHPQNPLQNRSSKRKELDSGEIPLTLKIKQNNLVIKPQTEIMTFIPSLTSDSDIELSDIDYSLGESHARVEAKRRWDNYQEKLGYINLGLRRKLDPVEIRYRYFANVFSSSGIKNFYNRLFNKIRKVNNNPTELKQFQLAAGIKSKILFKSLCKLAKCAQDKKKQEIDYIPQTYKKVIKQPAGQAGLPLKTPVLTAQLDRPTSVVTSSSTPLQKKIKPKPKKRRASQTLMESRKNKGHRRSLAGKTFLPLETPVFTTLLDRPTSATPSSSSTLHKITTPSLTLLDESAINEGYRKWTNLKERCDYICLALLNNMKMEDANREYFAGTTTARALCDFCNYDLFPNIRVLKDNPEKLTKYQTDRKISDETFMHLCLFAFTDFTVK